METCIFCNWENDTIAKLMKNESNERGVRWTAKSPLNIFKNI